MKPQDFNIFDVVDMIYIEDDIKERTVPIVVDKQEDYIVFRDIISQEPTEWTFNSYGKFCIKVLSVWNLKNKLLHDNPELQIWL